MPRGTIRKVGLAPENRVQSETGVHKFLPGDGCYPGLWPGADLAPGCYVVATARSMMCRRRGRPDGLGDFAPGKCHRHDRPTRREQVDADEKA